MKCSANLIIMSNILESIKNDCLLRTDEILSWHKIMPDDLNEKDI